MSWDAGNEDRVYKVVVNHEEQYSIWPAEADNPVGWSAVGTRGTRTECLTYIAEVWTDMRPLSLRRSMAEHTAQTPASSEATTPRLADIDLTTCTGQGHLEPLEV